MQTWHTMRLTTHKLLFLFALLLCATPAWADQNYGGTRSSGYFAEPSSNGDPNASYLQLNTSTLNQNERVFTPNPSYFTGVDNGPGMTYTLDLNTVPILKGGTGATTQQGAADAILNFPSVSIGDVLYRNGSNNWARLGIGSSGDVLTVTGGLPAWSAPALGIGSNLPFVTIGNDAGLSQERALTGTANKITITDNGGNSSVVLNVGTDITQNTETQTLTNKTLTGPSFSWNAGGGFTLKGQAFDTAIKWADWGAARNITVPDPGADADFVLTQANQTIAGTKTFSVAPTLTSGTLTAGANLQTFPSTAQTLVGRTSADTLTNKTLTAPAISSSSLTLKQTTADYTVSWANPSSARAYAFRDVGTDADIAMKEANAAYTAGGAVYAHGGVFKVTANGTSGHPLISGGTGAPAFNLLGIAGGGTNNGSLGVSALGIYAGDSSKMIQVTGTAGQSFRVNAGGTAIEPYTPGGGVSSVGVSVSNFPLTVGSSPITSSGTITLTPSCAKGDLIGGTGSNTMANLTVGSNGNALIADSSAITGFKWGVSANSIQDGRLTLTSGTSRTTSDVLTATSAYFTPDIGNRISLYNGSAWEIKSFTEITISLSGLTNALPYDVFIYNNSGTITADVVAWSNATTRATAIAIQDGIPCKTGALERRYVGTLLMSATGQCEDSIKFRGVFNANNKIARKLKAIDTTDTWTYNAATFRSFNNSTTLGVGKVSLIVGLTGDLAHFKVISNYRSTASANYDVVCGVGIDSTTVNSADIFSIGPSNQYLSPGYDETANAEYAAALAVGSHDVYPLEKTKDTTARTFQGDNGGLIQSGLLGELLMFAPKSNVIPFQHKIEDYGYADVA